MFNYKKVSSIHVKEREMVKNKLVLMFITCLVLSYASTASAAMTLKKIGISPFYRPPLTSEADLKKLVKTKGPELKIGFAKAGYADLYPAFEEQFPTAKIEAIKIKPGETVQWMMFKKKGKGPVAVAKDVTWGGKAPLDAYRFYITKDQKRYEIVVPFLCGNVALKDVAEIPPPPKPVVPPPVVQKPAPVAPKKGGFIVDGGIAGIVDPRTFLFGRVGYEHPLTDNLYVMGLIGGFGRVGGDKGGSAFVADVILDYRWTRFSVGLGGGYWSAEGGKFDLIADLGYRLGEDANTFLGRSTLFFEVRSAVDQMDEMRDKGRLGLGFRYRF
jgi:hypothetical protein